MTAARQVIHLPPSTVSRIMVLRMFVNHISRTNDENMIGADMSKRLTNTGQIIKMPASPPAWGALLAEVTKMR
jgi:hypothetical protein